MISWQEIAHNGSAMTYIYGAVVGSSVVLMQQVVGQGAGHSLASVPFQSEAQANQWLAENRKRKN